MSMTILTIDDSASVRKMLEFALKSRGYTVLSASDGQEGLEHLERGAVVNAIVLDINMPRLDGLSFLKTVRARAEWQKVPIMMLTTEGQEADRDRALELGATDYMRKPFKPSELLERVGKLLAA